jgi:hypothetical protein
MKITIISDDGSFAIAISLGIRLRNRGFDVETVLDEMSKKNADVEIVLSGNIAKIHFSAQNKDMEVKIKPDFEDILNAIEDSSS